MYKHASSARTMEFHIRGLYHGFRKTDLRICIKDYKWNKNLKIQLVHVSFSSSRQLWSHIIYNCRGKRRQFG
jgi:hypothetical protein